MTTPRHELRTGFCVLFLAALVTALAFGAVTYADDTVADGDGATPVANNALNFGTVCVGSTNVDTALVAIQRSQASPDSPSNDLRVFNDGATVTVSLKSPPDDSTDLTESVTDSSIVLPADWESLALTTMSTDTATISVTLVPSAAVAQSKNVFIRASGLNRTGSQTINRDTTLKVNWTGVSCDTDPPAVTHSIGTPSYTSGSDTYVTSASTLNFNVNETDHGNSGLSTCTISVDGPGSSDANFGCSEGNNNYTLSTSAPLSLSSAPDGSYLNSASATDNFGNTGSDSFTVILDNTAPAFGACTGGPFLLGSGGGSEAVSITASDSGSGLDNAGSTLSGTVDTTSVGTKTVNYTAQDNLGNTANTSCDYAVIYDFDGFFQPVENPDTDTFNTVKAGQVIPIKFSLSGDQGLSIFASGYPKSFEIDCITAADIDSIESTVTAGGSGLNYDSAGDQYIYPWKTEKGWANSCRQLDVKLNDGTTHSAWFAFTN